MSNTIKKTTLVDRVKRSVEAFKGNPIGNLYFGIDVKRCDQCEYKNVPEIRDNLLVTAGARAAYMNCSDKIGIPEGIEEEFKLAEFLTKMETSIYIWKPNLQKSMEVIPNGL